MRRIASKIGTHVQKWSYLWLYNSQTFNAFYYILPTQNPNVKVRRAITLREGYPIHLDIKEAGSKCEGYVLTIKIASMKRIVWFWGNSGCFFTQIVPRFCIYHIFEISTNFLLNTIVICKNENTIKLPGKTTGTILDLNHGLDSYTRHNYRAHFLTFT